MNRVTHHLIQGSAEWAEHRASHRNASEAAAMLGLSPYVSRDELLRIKATGLEPTPDAHQQRIYDEGHAFEAAARPVAERIIGEDLFAPTMSVDVNGLALSASLDGITMSGGVIWEHKTLSQTLRDALGAGQIPEHHRAQLEQQLLVSGATRALFMGSLGTEESAASVWYESDPELRERILSGWAQFERDLAAYEPPARREEPVGARPEDVSLPVVQVEGRVLSTNLDAYREGALAVIEKIGTDLQTDQDFADAEQAVKWCKAVEDKLDAAKEGILSQTADIDAVMKTIDEIRETARQKRLGLDKLVKRRKDEIRQEIAAKALADFTATLAEIDAEFEGTGVRLPTISVSFGEAMKGKRNIESLQSAVNDELARGRMRAHEAAQRIRSNLAILDKEGGEFPDLFADRQDLVLLEADNLREIVRSRVERHKAKLAEERAAAEREASAKLQAPPPEPEARPAPAAPERSVDAEASDSPQPAPQQPAAPPVYPGDTAIASVVMERFGVDYETAIDWMARAVDGNRRAA